MKYSELYQIAFQSLTSDVQNNQVENIKNEIIFHEKNLLRFILLCSNHLVLPVIYDNLQEAGLMQYFSEDFAEHLKEIL